MNRSSRRRIRWLILFSLAVFVLLAVIGWRFVSSRHLLPHQFLAQVIDTEKSGVDQSSVQPLGWNLAVLGRDDEIRRMDFHPFLQLPSTTIDAETIELDVVPWRQGIQEIAANQTVVMIMEDHFVSKHREFIEATLPAFRDAGFNHFAAEGLGESGKALAARGYPSFRTGFYTCDPQFGNLLRSALALDFEIHAYDFWPFSHEGREEYAAGVLAKQLKTDPEAKLLVHAGHSHVLKHETETGDRWLASRLWEKTGVEPFTIWQWSSMHDAHEYRAIVQALKDREDFFEPVLLMPPPDWEPGFRSLPRVDAILVHPPDQSEAPAGRTALFPDAKLRITGRWITKQWPVVISAYKKGEPITAIPYDQVMLRDAEQNFTLWIPENFDYEIRVFDAEGLLESSLELDGGTALLRTDE